MLQLARPYEDEILWSALARGCRHLGVSFTVLTRHGLRMQGFRPSFFGVSPMALYARLFDMSAEQLLQRHTVLPFALAFVTRDVKARVVRIALSGQPSARALGATIQSVVGGMPYRRFCPECISEDRQREGESYWHLTHQLPGVFCCPTHGVALQATSISVTGPSRTLDMPADVTGRPLFRKALPFAWRLIAAACVTAARQGLRDEVAVSSRSYRDLAHSRGWVRAGRHVDQERLADHVRRLLGSVWLANAGVPIEDRTEPWPGLMLRSANTEPSVTLKHLILRYLLVQDDGPPINLEHVPRGPSAKPVAASDATFARRAIALVQSYKRQRKKVRIADLLARAQCWEAYRHRRSAFPRLQRVIQRFKESPVASRPDALRCFEVTMDVLPTAGDSWCTSMTRQQLIGAGLLLSSKVAAERLGVPWPQMKKLSREGRILCVRYAGRDWYPAFWFDRAYSRSKLEDAHRALHTRTVHQQWQALVRQLPAMRDGGGLPVVPRHSKEEHLHRSPSKGYDSTGKATA